MALYLVFWCGLNIAERRRACQFKHQRAPTGSFGQWHADFLDSIDLNRS